MLLLEWQQTLGLWQVVADVQVNSVVVSVFLAPNIRYLLDVFKHLTRVQVVYYSSQLWPLQFGIVD